MSPLPLILISNRYRLFLYYAFECSIILNYACECPIIPKVIPAKFSTYNSKYANTLGSGLATRFDGKISYIDGTLKWYTYVYTYAPFGLCLTCLLSIFIWRNHMQNCIQYATTTVFILI